MIGITYEKKTGKIRSMLVPENIDDEASLNGFNPPLLSDEDFMLFGEEINGVPSVIEMQNFLNKKLGI